MAHWGLSGQEQTNKVKLSLTGLGRPVGLQEVEAATFHYSRHMKVGGLSVLPTGRLYPQEEVEAATFHYSRHMKLGGLSVLPTGRLYPQEISLVLISIG
jgi:hypothetical protein